MLRTAQEELNNKAEGTLKVTETIQARDVLTFTATVGSRVVVVVVFSDQILSSTLNIEQKGLTED